MLNFVLMSGEVLFNAPEEVITGCHREGGVQLDFPLKGGGLS